MQDNTLVIAGYNAEGLKGLGGQVVVNPIMFYELHEYYYQLINLFREKTPDYILTYNTSGEKEWDYNDDYTVTDVNTIELYTFNGQSMLLWSKAINKEDMCIRKFYFRYNGCVYGYVKHHKEYNNVPFIEYWIPDTFIQMGNIPYKLILDIRREVEKTTRRRRTNKETLHAIGQFIGLADGEMHKLWKKEK